MIPAPGIKIWLVESMTVDSSEINNWQILTTAFKFNSIILAETVNNGFRVQCTVHWRRIWTFSSHLWFETWAEAMTPARCARRIFFRPRWEPVRRRTHEKNIVLVVSPLINPMKNQGSRLNSRGISTKSFSDVSSKLEIRAVENG